MVMQLKTAINGQMELEPFKRKQFLHEKTRKTKIWNCDCYAGVRSYAGGATLSVSNAYERNVYFVLCIPIVEHTLTQQNAASPVTALVQNFGQKEF